MTGPVADRLSIVAFDKNGSNLAAVAVGKRLRVWSADTGSLLHTLNEPDHLNVEYSCMAIATTSQVISLSVLTISAAFHLKVHYLRLRRRVRESARIARVKII